MIGRFLARRRLKDPLRRFDDTADDYARYRPDYPADAISAIVEGLDLSRCAVADVGAGTGISARQVADRLGGSAVVHAIEPNAAMRAAAAGHARVRWIASAAEATTLAPASVDLIVCAQAFHWFRSVEALDEFHRIARPGARVALLTNVRDKRDVLTQRYNKVCRELLGTHPIDYHGNHRDKLRKSRLFGGFTERSFPHEQRLGAEDFAGRLRSSSRCPKSGPAWERVHAALMEIHRELAGPDGLVTMKYQTGLVTATRS